MTSTFALSIIDTQREIYSGEAIKLTIPAVGGQMTVLANHMPIVTPVALGEIVLTTPTDTIALTIGKGMFSMDGRGATLLIEDANYLEEISEKTSEEAKAKALEIIEKGITGPDLTAALYTVRKSNLDLKVARRNKLRASR